MNVNPTSSEFFEQMYRQAADPWQFASSTYERDRYAAILDALPQRPYRRAFEPGCSIGILTKQLAGRCERVEALDLSATAVGRAQELCHGLGHVHIQQGSVAGSLPDGSFDLIVFSEIGYYVDEAALATLGSRLVEKLEGGGVFLAAHWLGSSPDHVLSGDKVHEVLSKLDGLVHDYGKRYDGFRLDRWVRA